MVTTSKSVDNDRKNVQREQKHKVLFLHYSKMVSIQSI